MSYNSEHAAILLDLVPSRRHVSYQLVLHSCIIQETPVQQEIGNMSVSVLSWMLTDVDGFDSA